MNFISPVFLHALRNIPDIDSDLEAMIQSCMPQVSQFCRKYKTSLIGVEQTRERGYVEPLFIFSDEVGGYTLDGIKGSL